MAPSNFSSHLLVCGNGLGKGSVDLVSKRLSGSLLVSWSLGNESCAESLGVGGSAGEGARGDSLDADLLEVGLNGNQSSRDLLDGGLGSGEGVDDGLSIGFRDGVGVGLDVSGTLLDGVVEITSGAVDGEGGEVVLK